MFETFLFIEQTPGATSWHSRSLSFWGHSIPKAWCSFQEGGVYAGTVFQGIPFRECCCRAFYRPSVHRWKSPGGQQNFSWCQ